MNLTFLIFYSIVLVFTLVLELQLQLQLQLELTDLDAKFNLIRPNQKSGGKGASVGEAGTVDASAPGKQENHEGDFPMIDVSLTTQKVA